MAQGTGHRAQTKRRRDKVRKRRQDVVQDEAKVVSDGSPPRESLPRHCGGLGVGSGSGCSDRSFKSCSLLSLSIRFSVSRSCSTKCFDLELTE